MKIEIMQTHTFYGMLRATTAQSIKLYRSAVIGKKNIPVSSMFSCYSPTVSLEAFDNYVKYASHMEAEGHKPIANAQGIRVTDGNSVHILPPIVVERWGDTYVIVRGYNAFFYACDKQQVPKELKCICIANHAYKLPTQKTYPIAAPKTVYSYTATEFKERVYGEERHFTF